MRERSLEGLKIVTAQEMARVEEMAYAEGHSEQTFMENAGTAIATAVAHFVDKRRLPKVVTLLVGKGNNGGDAFAAGIKLMQWGFKVHAVHIYSLDKCSPLCKKMYEEFRTAGGKIRHVHDQPDFGFEAQGIILDGLVGTGFRGRAEGMLALAIERANLSGLPILAIDIPSGLNGTTGEVETIAVCATETISLGLPKIGFFLKDGWDHVGELKHASFGLPDKYIVDAKPVAFLLNESRISSCFPKIKRTRHKYQAGYVLSIAGSPGMPGAALLASFTALRAGAGIVRLFHPRGMEAELSGAPFELIREGWDSKDMDRLLEEAARAKSLLIGPGISRTKTAKKMLHQILKEIALPMVIDADALYFLSQSPSWKIPKGSILTPHHGEMNLLLSGKKSDKKTQKGMLALCQAFAQEKKATIVLKGAPTIIFHPGTIPLIIIRGDPGMATAGSGDVLTGIIAAMVAQGLDPRSAAALSVYLHGISGEIAADFMTSYCITASDLIDFLPDAFKSRL